MPRITYLSDVYLWIAFLLSRRFRAQSSVRSQEESSANLPPSHSKKVGFRKTKFFQWTNGAMPSVHPRVAF
jgi:hypothetical protein